MCDCGKGTTDRSILNLPATGKLTEDDIKKAYKKCALKCHPDKYRTPEAHAIFQKIGNAYDSLLENPNGKPFGNAQDEWANWDRNFGQGAKAGPANNWDDYDTDDSYRYEKDNEDEYGYGFGGDHYHQLIKDLLVEYSKVYPEIKVSNLFSSKQIDELFKQYYIDSKKRDKYKPLIMNFKLNPEFNDPYNYTESSYKKMFQDLNKLQLRHLQKEYLLKKQVHWILEALNKNPYEADEALKYTKLPEKRGKKAAAPPKKPASPPKPAAAAAASPPKNMKRCPKGTRRNKKTGLCEETKKAAAASAAPEPAAAAAEPSPKSAASQTKKKRCPNGTRRNPKTGNCEPKK